MVVVVVVVSLQTVEAMVLYKLSILSDHERDIYIFFVGDSGQQRIVVMVVVLNQFVVLVIFLLFLPFPFVHYIIYIYIDILGFFFSSQSGHFVDMSRCMHASSSIIVFKRWCRWWWWWWWCRLHCWYITYKQYS